MKDDAPKLAQLLAGPRYVRIVDWPGRPDLKVGLRVLRGDEQQQAAFEAVRAYEVEKIAVTAATLDAFQDHLATCRLARALVTADPPHRSVVSGGAELQGLLGNAEKAALLEEYLDLEASFSVDLTALSDAECADLLEALKNEPRHWTDLSVSTLRRLARTLAFPPAPSPTASGLLS